MALYLVEITTWRSYFSCRGYSSSVLTWKYCMGAVFVAGNFVLGFFVGGDSGEGGGGVAGLVMIGDGCIVAVFCVRSCVMCCLVVSCSVCVCGGDISLSIAGCRLAGVDLVVVGGLVAVAGWRGHSPAEGAGCLLLSALFL